MITNLRMELFEALVPTTVAVMGADDRTGTQGGAADQPRAPGGESRRPQHNKHLIYRQIHCHHI